MRCTQEMGLSGQAKQWLDNNASRTPVQTCNLGHKHGGKMISFVYSHTTGMFDEKIPLYEFMMLDGRFVQEYVQACPWSSGPCIFLALKWKDGDPITETLWDDVYIDNA